MKKLYTALIIFIAIAIAGLGTIAYFFYQENQTRLVIEANSRAKSLFAYDTQKLSYENNKQLKSIKNEFNLKIEQRFNQLSKQQKLGRLFMISIPGQSLSSDVINFINTYQIGGVIIMGGNVESKGQLKQLISDLRAQSDHDLLIAVDQEGFPVARIPWEKYANMNGAVLGTTNNVDTITRVSKSRADELKDLGFDINFSPVVDVRYPGSWIGIRSFANTPEKVGEYVIAAVRGQKQGDIYSTAKHFPGLGRTSKDTHELLPTINTSKQELLRTDLLPFRKLIKENIELIMIGHTLYPDLDADAPATLSKRIQTDLLRDELGFKGLIITDDMKMGALNGFTNKYSKALQAGSNILLLVDMPNQVISAIKSTTPEIDEAELDEKLRELYRFVEINE